MRKPHKSGHNNGIPNDSGQLSIDFVVGLSIFMIAFAIVAGMASGLLVGLQSRSIDYDAVAYRTGVILTEDPGEITETVGVSFIAPDRYSWDLLYPDYYQSYSDSNILRLGMAMPRYYYDMPSNVLMVHKIDEFFNTSRYRYDFYRNKIIFSTFPYRFNVSITKLDGSQTLYMGDNFPVNSQHGYIKRVVMIKRPANMTIDTYEENANGALYVPLNFRNLTAGNPGYMVYPSLEKIIIKMSNFTESDAEIDRLKVCSPTCEDPPSLPPTIHINRDNGSFSYSNYPIVSPVAVNNTTYIEIDPGYLSRRYFPNLGPVDTIELQVNFTSANPINIGGTHEYVYSPNASIFQQPDLVPAVLEVRIW